MNRISIIALLLVCTIATTRAQNETQALRFSAHNPFGTARFAAQGGAIGALGGDLGAVQVNPAGLAFYRSSEFSFTPSFYWVNTSSNFMGTSIDETRFRFNVGSLGYVATKSSNRRSGFVGAAFSFGYNTLANFNNRTTMTTGSASSSMLDDFTWHANDDSYSPYYEDVAIDANLLFFSEAQQEFTNDFKLNNTYGQRMNRLSEQSGYIGEYAFSGALNFSNLIYIGTTFGLHSVRFYEDIYHTEADAGNHVPEFREFRFREFNSTQGWGYTFRFGMIIRPIQLIRVGASFQTPVYYHLSEDKYTDMNSYFDSGSTISDAYAYSPNGFYDYKLKSPMKVNVNASVILFKAATLSAGYEFLDYSSSRLDAYDDRFIEENERIGQDLQPVHNLRAGAELRLNLLYFRGGIQHLMSPYAASNNNAESWIYAGGMGIRTRSMIFDVSYSRGNRSEVYGMYAVDPNVSEVSLNQIYTNNLMVTMGLKF